MNDLFADQEAPWQEPLAPGAVVLRGFARAHADTLLAAVHLHGLAGNRICIEQGIDSGLLADELAPIARRCFNEWIKRGIDRSAPTQEIS